jgi:SAM-dependent methyltransferase
MRNLISFHQMLLQDKERMDTFRRAILKTVQPGDVVLDIGTGSGILAFFACQAGAARVYAVERTDILEVAKKLAKANQFEARIVFLSGELDTVEVPERVDVITSELIAKALLGEQMAEILSDARHRFLKPGGKLIPADVQLFVAPVQSEAAYQRVELPPKSAYDLDFSSLRSFSTHTTASARFQPDELLADGQIAYHLDTATVAKRDLIKTTLTFRVTRRATLHGFCGWFSANLADGVTLSNVPPGTHSWDNLFFPLMEPVEVNPATVIELQLKGSDASRSGMVWQWMTIIRAGTAPDAPVLARYNQSTFFSQLYAPNRLRKRAHDYIPTLNESGQIAHLVLTLMPEGLTSEAIARRISAQFPKRFPEWHDALRCVSELVDKYSQ